MTKVKKDYSQNKTDTFPLWERPVSKVTGWKERKEYREQWAGKPWAQKRQDFNGAIKIALDWTKWESTSAVSYHILLWSVRNSRKRLGGWDRGIQENVGRGIVGQSLNSKTGTAITPIGWEERHSHRGHGKVLWLRVFRTPRGLCSRLHARHELGSKW